MTIHSFFQQAMLNLFEQDESFSGKRPLGNSGWREDMINAFSDVCSREEAEELIREAIRSL